MQSRVFHNKNQLIINNLIFFTKYRYLHWYFVDSSSRVYVTQLVTPVGHLFVYVFNENIPGIVLAVDDWTNVIYANKCECLSSLLSVIQTAIIEDTPPMLPKIDESWPKDFNRALYILDTHRRLTHR